MTNQPTDVEKQCDQFREVFEKLRSEIGKVIVGHGDIVEGVLVSLFCGGHDLLEGATNLHIFLQDMIKNPVFQKLIQVPGCIGVFIFDSQKDFFQFTNEIPV